MKNIHILTVYKPSRLFYDISLDKLVFATTAEMSKWFDNKHIYITSDEEIKQGDWFYDNDGELCKYTSDYVVTPNKWSDNQKIILTTDQDLIKDGVQAIDDEFVEWFVKNPNCEQVEVKIEDMFDETYGEMKGIYHKIIIPQEETPKQETVERSDLFNSILSIVKKIPREDVEGDAMDAPSCAYELEQLFYKWQAERNNMKVYYLTSTELGWDNVINIHLSPQKCIEDYTGGEVILETEEEVEQYLKENRTLYIGYEFINE